MRPHWFNWIFGYGSVLIFALNAVAAEPPPRQENWRLLFDGKSLQQWKSSPFGGEGEVRVENGQITLPRGNDMTGICWQGDFPREDYELALEAMRVEGNDFFCGLTFPVSQAYCSLILGGWGGHVAGLSNIDRRDASDNQTTQIISFDNNRWYAVRLQVTTQKITVLLDGKPIIELDRAEHEFGTRPEVELSKPLGISTWRTCGAVRNIRFKPLTP